MGSGADKNNIDKLFRTYECDCTVEYYGVCKHGAEIPDDIECVRAKERLAKYCHE